MAESAEEIPSGQQKKAQSNEFMEPPPKKRQCLETIEKSLGASGGMTSRSGIEFSSLDSIKDEDLLPVGGSRKKGPGPKPSPNQPDAK